MSIRIQLGTVVCLACSLLLSCSGYRSYAPIPSHITEQEMQVYSAWLQSYKQKHPEQKIEVSETTLPIPSDGIEEAGERDATKSDREALRGDGVDVAAFNELAALGGAFSYFKKPFDPKLANFRSPCGENCLRKEIGANAEIASVSFSRVVFSRDGNTALLHTGCILTAGKATYGGQFFYVLATRSGTEWSFRTVGNVAIS